MKNADLLSLLQTLSPDTEIVLQTPEGCYSQFRPRLCDYEHVDGSVIYGPDENGWGEYTPRPLPEKVLSLETHNCPRRGPSTF
ncbi:MAG: hypothetical protein RL097_90 [Candidatus Parcubacteria bacterium]|jgi:hypothetical protein